MGNNVASISEFQKRKSFSFDRPVITEGPCARWSANTDNSGSVLHEGWETMYGREGVVLARVSWIKLIHPDDRMDAAVRMLRGRLSQQPYVNPFRALIHGIYRPINTLVFPVRDAGGKIVRWEGYNLLADDLVVNL